MSMFNVQLLDWIEIEFRVYILFFLRIFASGSDHLLLVRNVCTSSFSMPSAISRDLGRGGFVSKWNLALKHGYTK